MLLTETLGSLPFIRPTAYAAPPPPPASANVTLDQYLYLGHLDQYNHAVPAHPVFPTVPVPNKQQDVPHLKHSVQSATAKPVQVNLDQSLETVQTANSAHTPGSGLLPQEVVSSDQALHVQIPRGALDLSQATTITGAAITRPVALKITQQHGLMTGSVNMLAAYDVRLLDAKGLEVQGVQLRNPVSYIYHYRSQDLKGLGLQANHLLMTWPDLARAAAKIAKTARTAASTAMAAKAVVPMVNDAKQHTLTAQSMVLAAGPLTAGAGSTSDESPHKPNLASVEGNSGQLSYTYPLAVAAGPTGTVPQLQMTYSSGATNGRTSPIAPTSAFGEGWAVSMGSISLQNYPDGSSWYSISGIDNINDRLIEVDQGSSGGSDFVTEHLSYLHILNETGDTGLPCFYVWAPGGTLYEYGCTQDSLQYYTDGDGNQQYYRWDLSTVVTANQGPNTNNRSMHISYLQDSIDSGATIRDAVIDQIRYGTKIGSTTTTAGTVDFSYLAPFDNAPWATSYGSTSYYDNCSLPDGLSSSVRCDDPLDYSGGLPAPSAMSTFSLQSVTSYVGTNASSSQKVASYQFAYQDTPFYECTDAYSQTTAYCAGSHLLTSITPTIYQNGTGHQLKGLDVSYSGAGGLQDDYYDSTNLVGSLDYHAFTNWQYMTSFHDNSSGVGETITYQTAHNNTNGTPLGANGDTRLDPFYCSVYPSDCLGDYAPTDDRAWSQQLVTSITSSGKDSGASSLLPAKTTYQYTLAVTGSGCTAAGSDTRCVSDVWLPTDTSGTTDSDWQDFYHGEFHGFNTVSTYSPAGDVTVDTYDSTAGMGTDETDPRNYTAGQLRRHDRYWGSVPSDSSLISRTDSTYAGDPGTSSSGTACNTSASILYTPCLVAVVSTRSTSYEGNGAGSSGMPWVQHDYTFDDFTSTGLVTTSGVYHNLKQEVVSSSNAPTVTQKMTYQPTDTTISSWIYYDVNKVSHREIDDASGHIWQCQDTTYDEGRASGVPSPAAGWPTTMAAYSDCSHQSTTAIKKYTGYDLFGNVLAKVDAFGVAHSSLYSSNGCTLSSAPSYLPAVWSAGKFTACITYDSYNTRPIVQKNVLGQSTSTGYDYTQGGLPTSVTDLNGQITSTGYSYDSNGNAIAQVHEPNETASYTSQIKENALCTDSSTLPCFEVDKNASLYPNAISQTFYNSQGRTAEMRTPLDASNDLITFTIHNEANNTLFKSVPFRYPHGTSWVDPSTAKIDNGSIAPTGTITLYDPVGRTRATQDPALGSTAEPGITCSGLSGTWTSCLGYGVGYAYGDTTAQYAYTVSRDANNHMTTTFADALGRAVYHFWYSTAGSVSSNITTKQTTLYNALDLPISITQKDLAPQTGESPVQVIAMTTYDDMGRAISVSDPDRGNHTLSYDADGRVLTDISGTRTLGSSYDLLGRVRCLQDAVPTTDGSGNCSSGSHPLLQTTYSTSFLGTVGSTDFPLGLLTQSIATTYYPDSTSATTTQQYQHNQRGQLVASKLQIGVPSSWGVTTTLPNYLETQAYNDADQPTMTQTKVGSVIGYTFSQAYDSSSGGLKGLSNNGTGVANLATLSLNNHGLLSDINFQTSTGTALADNNFTYDGDLRSAVSSAAWQSGSGSTGTIFSSNRTYDPAGNVVSVATTHAVVPGQSASGGSSTEAFCYDEMNRLVWAGNTGSVPAAGNGTCGTATPSDTLSGANYSNTHTYTHLGQIWQAPLNGTGAAQQYLYCDTTHPHQLTGIYPSGTTCATHGSATASYSASFDAWGNQLSRTYNSVTATLSYDVADHLVKWDAGATNRAWYSYDAGGNRIVSRNTTGSGTSLTVYAFGLEEHVYNATGTNTGNTYYYTLAGRLLGKFDGTTTQYYLTDAQGSVLSTFNAVAGSAKLLANQLYGPYGKQLYTKGPIGTNKGYTGQYNDATGLDYYNARYYDPVVGRFVSADVKEGNAQGMDPYAYVHGNPETMTDPTGQCPDCGMGGAEGGVETSWNTPCSCYGPAPVPPPPPVVSWTAPVSAAVGAAVGAAMNAAENAPQGGSTAAPAPQAPPTLVSQSDQADVTLASPTEATDQCDITCHANRADKSLKEFNAKEAAKNAIAGDFLTMTADVGVLLTNSMTGGLGFVSTLLNLFGNLIPHLLHTVGDIYIALTGQIPQALHNAMVIAEQIAVAANFLNGLLTFVVWGTLYLDKIEQGIGSYLASFVGNMAFAASRLGGSYYLSRNDMRIYNEYQRSHNSWDSETKINMCKDAGLTDC